MASRVAKVRAALTAIGVVFAAALVLGIVILVLGSLVGYVGGTVFGGGDGTGFQGPDAEFETTLANDSVDVRYVDAEPIDASGIVFEVDGESQGTWATYAAGDPSTIEEGDAVTIDGVAPGDELVVRWTDGEVSQVLHRETLEP
ncbi:type IV pilin [Halovivax cerinus]|uniref:Type IV pilin n=1 Tax=Halovivax cerinus TaxID=1487865 RepID=A0ABD5NT80_9EURY|nr:type IV pilin [Halovivax cerinus]